MTPGWGSGSVSVHSDDGRLDPDEHAARAMTTDDTEPSGDYLRQVLDASSDALLVVDEDLRIKWVSGAVRRLGDWTPAELLSSDPMSLLHPEDVDTALANFADLLGGGNPDDSRSVCRVARRDGSWLWVEMVGNDLRGDPAVRGVVLSMRDVSRQLAADEAVRNSERRLRALLENSNDCLVVCDRDLIVTYASDPMVRILGFRPEDAIGGHVAAAVQEPDRAALIDAHREVIDDAARVRRLQVRCTDSTGATRWIETVIANHLDDDEVAGVVSNFRDVTEHRRASSALREQTAEVARARQDRRLLSEIFDLSDDLAVLFDATGRVRYMNAAARRFFDVESVEHTGRLGVDWHPEGTWLEPIEAMVGGESVDRSWSGEATVVRPHGEVVPMLVQVLVHDDAADPDHRSYSVVGRDIGDRKRLELSLEQQATHDSLTGLANRSLLFERIAHALHGLRQVPGRHSIALLFVDIDHFKSVNDTLGHALGDQVLRSVADRITGVVRPGDTVARFGGDEFVVLCERLDRPEDAVVIAHRIESALRAPWVIGGREVQLGVSIGISFADESDDDPSAVLRDADTAMYRAKADGRGRWVIFDDELRERATERQRIETSLRRTSHGEELELYYQPVVELATGRITGVESLLRWRHDGRLVQPADFVPIAEETGLIVPVGAWALETACEQLSEWQALPGWEDMRLAVNVSARQLQHPSFAGVVAEVTDASVTTPGSLWLEITESVMLDDVVSARSRLERLKLLGVRIALDDFGTGYSSLTYLRSFPVDAVKLDRSFVAGIGVDDGDTAIVNAVVNLAHALDKECVAEGVETAAQADALRRLGCRSAQGYHFAKPLSADEVTDLLLDRHGLLVPMGSMRG